MIGSGERLVVVPTGNMEPDIMRDEHRRAYWIDGSAILDTDLDDWMSDPEREVLHDVILRNRLLVKVTR